MAEAPTCQRCGRVLGPELQGLCPSCLLADTLSGSDEDDSYLLPHAQRIGAYEIIEEIARGGMGIIYRARQSQPERIVALKVMAPWLLTQPAMLTRFRNEADAVARLDHSGILPIFEVGEHEGLPFFSMRFAEGGNLHQCKDSYRGRWREIAALMSRVARAVHHAHTRGILHRDIKPANILFSGDHEPLVADFGLAKWPGGQRQLTLPASVLGSPEYMAPEQLNQAFGEISPATDVYALGAVLYELVCGRPPLQDVDSVAALRRVTVVDPPLPREIDSGTPPALEAIVMQCLQKLPGSRYASAAALADDLDRFVTAQPITATHPLQRRARKWRLVTGVTALIAILTVVLAWYVGGRERSSLGASSVSENPLTVTVGDLRQSPIGIDSLLVFPFGTDERNSANTYLSNALAAALGEQLVRDSTLRVESFRGDAATLTESVTVLEIARARDVDAFVEGLAQRTHDRLTIDARLVRTHDGQVIWLGRIVAEPNDVVGAAKAVATQVQAELNRRRTQEKPK